MRIKFFLLLFIITAVSLTFASQSGVLQRDLQQIQADVPSWSFIESTPVPAEVMLLDPLTLTLDLPSVIRLGDAEVFRMTIAIDSRGDVVVATNESRAAPIVNIEDAFDSYNVIAQARLDLPRLSTSPADKISQPIRAGQSVTFTWTVRADAVGEYDGTAWAFLRFVPKDEDANLAGQDSGPMRELAMAAIPFNLRVVSFGGMKGSAARIIGTVGLLVSILIALPLLLDRLYRRTAPS